MIIHPSCALMTAELLYWEPMRDEPETSVPGQHPKNPDKIDPVPLKCFDEQECYEVILVAAKKVKQAIRNRNTFSGCRIKCIYA